MSIRAINWAIELGEDEKVTPTMRHILLVLANYANEADLAYPRQTTVARITGLKRQTVCINIGLLEAAGLITATGRTHKTGATRSSEYRMKIPGGPKYDAEDVGGVSENDTGGVSQNDRGVSQDDSGCQDNGQGGVSDDDTLNPYLDPSLEPKQEPKRKRKTAPWPSDYREQFWALYPKRKNTSKKAALEKLAKLEAEDRVEFEVIMAGLKHFAERTNAEVARDRSREQFICHAITWVNQERWESEGPADRRPQPPKRTMAI